MDVVTESPKISDTLLSGSSPTSNWTKLSPNEETKFQEWYRGFSSHNQIDRNPDNPLHKFDHRGWWKSFQDDPSLIPTIDPRDNLIHGPSQFKDKDHPTMWKDDYMKYTGRDPDNDRVTKQQWGRIKKSRK